MFVRTVVLSLENKSKEKSKKKGNRIELSMRPSLINKHISKWVQGRQAYGAVKSIEEKVCCIFSLFRIFVILLCFLQGYVIDLGSKKETGFLAFKHAFEGKGEKQRLLVGQPMSACVSSVNGRTVKLQASADAVKEAEKKDVGGGEIALNELVPGMLVKATLLKVQFSKLFFVRIKTSSVQSCVRVALSSSSLFSHSRYWTKGCTFLSLALLRPQLT